MSNGFIVCIQNFEVLHLHGFLVHNQALESVIINGLLVLCADGLGGWVSILYWTLLAIGKFVLHFWTHILCLCFLVELLAILLILLSMLSLAAAVGVAYLDSLKLVLDCAYLVFNSEVLHLYFVNTDDILNLGVVVHGQLLRKW